MASFVKGNEAEMVRPVVAVTPETHGTSSYTGLRHDFRCHKLELPAFDETNLDLWVVKTEWYFALHQFSTEDKIEAAIISFESDALLWYQWENQRQEITWWEEMKVKLLQQFRSTQMGGLYLKWLVVKEDNDVWDYQWWFIELSAPLQNVGEEIAGNFYQWVKIQYQGGALNLRAHDFDNELA